MEANTTLQRIKRLVKKPVKRADLVIGRGIRSAYTLTQSVDPYKVFVMTFQETLTCNARYIVEELLRRSDQARIVVCGTGEPLPEFADEPRITYVKRKSAQQIVEQASARVWIDNALNCTWYPMMKKPNQLYLQTWHGSMGLKTIGAQNQTKRWLKSAKISSHQTDALLSNSTFESLVFRTTFWPTTPILMTGHARNDMFFDEPHMQQLGTKVHECFGVDKDARLALYAPTFRTTDLVAFDEADLDYPRLKQALEARFGGTWNIILRLHHRDKVNAGAISDTYPFVLNGTTYPDIQELMAASEVGITDYSSWICDYVLTGRPGFIFAPDLAEYEKDDRGFYYPLSATPFPVATSNADLVEHIASFDDDRYAACAARYLAELGCIEDGHASRRVADLIGEVLGKNDAIDLATLPTFVSLVSTD